MKRLKAFFNQFGARFLLRQTFKAYVLLVTQLALVLLLCGTLAFICIVRRDTFWIYLALVSTLAAVSVAALVLNLSGHYTPAAWITVAIVTLGPWGALLLDGGVAAGDYMPIMYIALSIQLCAMLLSQAATGIIAAVQLVALGLFIAHSAALRSMNWPSLVVFAVFVAVLGIMSSSVNRRQVKQIEAQRNQLLEDEGQLRELSVRDALTGLYNRRYMEQRLEAETARALRGGGSLCVVMVDVDGFKGVNDAHGHTPGDRLLCDVAGILRDGVRRSDIACRFGGDEFVLILPDCPLEDCAARAEAIRARMADTPLLYDEKEIGYVSLSLGVAALPGDGKTAAELLSAADAAMYAAKNEGKNRVRCARDLDGEDV